jgi:tetratricopeptide (TPR) repeat protein
MRGRAAALALAVTLAGATSRADPARARAALQRGDLEVAREALARLTPAQRPEGALLSARIAFETGAYEEVLRLAAALARTPLRARAQTLEGEALAALGRYDDALARWRDAARAPGAWRASALSAVWLRRLGREDEAREAANVLLDAYNDAVDGRAGARATLLRDTEFLASVALAARALGAAADANRALNEALQVSPDDAELHLAQADLMRSTEDYEPAGEAVAAALRVNPRSPRALLLRARLRVLSGHDTARITEDLDAASAVNPRLAAVQALRAMVALRGGDPAEATRALDAAGASNPRDLDVLAARAALRFRQSDLPGCRAALDALHAVAPGWAEGYQFLAEVADVEHRYAEVAEVFAASMARPGLVADREGAARLQAALGVNLLRLGREDEGLTALRASFERSRFNVRVANLLEFYERTIPGDYVTETLGPLRLRMHREERAALQRHASTRLRAAWDDMVRRYGFTPEGPVSIELYASSEHFSVRTSGVPEVGVQGVCFGRVVTALSPRAGSFNWAQITWHELAHVFALQRSRSRVPRWFTEGLSEWESVQHDPRWAREDDPSLWRALRGGRVPRIADFNRAFTHARSGDDMLLAYYAASQLVTFMIERWGFDRVVAALPLWGQDLETPAVIQRALGVPAEQVDREFLAWLRPRLARYDGQFDVDPREYTDRAAREAAVTARPDDADARGAAAVAALLAGDAQAAAAHAERAVRLVGAQPLARWVRAVLALRGNDGRVALDEIAAAVEGGADGFEMRTMEARAALRAGDLAREESALRAAVRRDPTQPETHRTLAALSARRGRADERAGHLRAAVALDQHDRDSLRALLALDLAASRWTEILALEELSLQLDPEHAAGRLAVAQAAAESGMVDRAVAALEDAARIEPTLDARVRARITELRAGRRGLPVITLPRREE